MLRQPCDTFDLPRELPEARELAARLLDVASGARQLHTFSKGVGLAAPQIGGPRAATLLWFPDAEPFVMLNPSVIDHSDETDEQYEGCLSFFDVRGLVPRPLTLRVEYASVDGNRIVRTFERGVARLVAHEIDHLHGILYRDRMRPGQEPIDVSEYQGTGTPWDY